MSRPPQPLERTFFLSEPSTVNVTDLVHRQGSQGGHTEVGFPECTAATCGDECSLLGSEVNEKAENLA